MTKAAGTGVRTLGDLAGVTPGRVSQDWAPLTLGTGSVCCWDRAVPGERSHSSPALTHWTPGEAPPPPS